MEKSPPVPRPEGIFHPLSFIRSNNPTVSIRKTSLPPDKLQYSYIGLQSKLQRQIAEGGIGSRKGRGPTKWGGPPAATAAVTLISATPVISAKPIISRTNLQHSHFGPQSKLQRQIAAGGIGSRKGRGPTKWGGPPAATAAATFIIATLFEAHKCTIPVDGDLLTVLRRSQRM